MPDYEALDPEKMYKLIVPTYIANGGDGYTVISENKVNHTSGKYHDYGERVVVRSCPSSSSF